MFFFCNVEGICVFGDCVVVKVLVMVVGFVVVFVFVCDGVIVFVIVVYLVV